METPILVLNVKLPSYFHSSYGINGRTIFIWNFYQKIYFYGYTEMHF
jgi:hypothetical protein